MGHHEWASGPASAGDTPRAASSKPAGTPEVRFSLTPQTVSMTPQTAVAIVDDDAVALEELTARSMRERSVSETQFEVMFNERPPSPKEMIKTKLGEAFGYVPPRAALLCVAAMLCRALP